MKKTMSILLAAAMTTMMGISVAAAEKVPSVRLDENELIVKTDDKRIKCELDDEEIFLGKNSDDEITVSFKDEDERNRKITLEDENEVVVSGKMDRLVVRQALDRDYTIRIAADAKIKRLDSYGKAKIVVDGEIKLANLYHKSALLQAREGSEIELVYAEEPNSVKGLYSHRVKRMSHSQQAEAPEGISSSYETYTYKNPLGISDVVDHGDYISFYADVSGASIYWNGRYLGKTHHGYHTIDTDGPHSYHDTLVLKKDGHTYDVFLRYATNYYVPNGWRVF